MKKKLTAKIQELNPTLPQYSGLFSKCLVVNPESKETEIRKGTIYSVFELQSEAAFDTELVLKVITDTMHNSYFQSENISPIQSMEKTITEIKERISQLSSEILRTDQPPAKFNILTGILWGNVLYIVQFGEMGAYYINIKKDNIVKAIPLISEGSFSASSEVLNDDNVVFFCTKEFEKSFPPEKFLTSKFSDQLLKTNETCLLMKMIVDTNFTEDEVVDFGLENAIAGNKAKIAVEKIGFSIKDFFTKIPLPFKKKVTNTVSTLSTIAYPKAAPPKKDKAGKLIYTIPFILLVLAISLFFISKWKNNNTKQVTQKNDNQVTTITEQEKTVEKQAESAPAENSDAQKQNDTQYKVIRIKPEAFYDIKITDSTAEPSEIAAFTDSIVTADRNSGKIFISSANTPKFEALSGNYPGIRALTNYDGKLGFLDNTGYKFYDLKASKVSNDLKITADNAYPYLTNIYAISGDTIRKYKNDTLEGVSWGQGEDFKNAKSMAIAYNIYIIKQDGELVSYTQGKKTDFSVKGLEKGLVDPVKIEANVDFKNLYIADRAAKSIVIINDRGELVKQYKTEGDKEFEDLRSISVSPDEKILYVLSGSRIYKIAL